MFICQFQINCKSIKLKIRGFFSKDVSVIVKFDSSDTNVKLHSENKCTCVLGVGVYWF